MEKTSKKMADLKYLHGTTTLAFICRSGIIIAVDSRASLGNYVGSSNVKKVIEIKPYLLGTMAGGAADCFFWERKLGCLCDLYEVETGKKITVPGASKMLVNMIFKYRNSGISMGTMIIGWDNNQPSIYYVDSEGNRLKVKMVSVGSGSTFAYGILETNYLWNLSIQKGYELARSAIINAAHKDPFSGGKINIYLVRKEGWIKLLSEDMGEH